MPDNNKQMTALKLSGSLRKRVKKRRDAICSATADWAHWSSAWRECWSTGRGRTRKEEGIDGWMEGARGWGGGGGGWWVEGRQMKWK